MAINYVVLKNEITNNPKEIPGLTWGEDNDPHYQWLANTLNTLDISGETIIRDSVAGGDIRKIICSTDKAEFLSITAGTLRQLDFLCSVSTLVPADIQDILKDTFPAEGEEGKPLIRAELIALAMRPASRSEKIPNLGVQAVSLQDVHRARRL